MNGARSLALLAILVLPGAAAAPTLTASEVEATGNVEATASLVAIMRTGNPGPSSAFLLQAHQLAVETDVSDPVLVVGATELDREPTTETATYGDARVEGAAVRPGYRWLVLPSAEGTLPSAMIADNCLGPPQDHHITDAWDPHVELRRGSLEPSEEAVFMSTPCTPNAHVTLRGDFTIVLWEWDAVLTAQGERTDLASGARESDMDPARTPESEAVIQEHREVFLHASDAVLDVAIGEGDVLFLQDAEMAVDGSVRLHEASGFFQAGSRRIDVEDSLVFARGDLDLAIEGNPQGLSLVFAGAFDEVQVDGQAVAGVAVKPTGTPVPVAWIATLAALGVAVLAWWTWRRPMAAARVHGPVAPPSTATTKREERGVGYYALAKAALGGRGGRRVLRRSEKAVKLHPAFVEAAMVRGIALLRLGRPERAIQDFEVAYRRLIKPEARAVAGLYAAKACIYMGELGAARQWVADAYNLATDVVTDQVQEPLFNALADDGLVRSLRLNPKRGARMPPGSIDPSIT